MDQGYPRGRGGIPPIPEDDQEERGPNRQYGGYSRPEDNPNWPLPNVPLPSAKLTGQPQNANRGDDSSYGAPRSYNGTSNAGPRSLYPQPSANASRPPQGIPNTLRNTRQQPSAQFQQLEQRQPYANYNPPTVGRPVLVNMPPRRNQSVDVQVETMTSPNMGYPSGISSSLSPTPSDFPFPDSLASPPAPAFTNPLNGGTARAGIPSSIYSPAVSPMLAPQRPGTSSRDSGSSYASSKVIPTAWAPLRDGRGNEPRYTTDSFGQIQEESLNFDLRNTQYTDVYQPPAPLRQASGSDNRIGYAVSTDFGAPGPISPQSEAGYGYFLKPDNVPRQVGSELYLMPTMARESQVTVSDFGDSSKPNDRTLVYSPTPTPPNEENNEDPITTKLNARGQFTRKAPTGLDLGKVKDAEARGSLTSLPDLIRRATKLAAVLETGRPESRFGARRSIDDFKEYMREHSKKPKKSSFMMLKINEDEKGEASGGIRSSTASHWPVFGDGGIGPVASPRPRAKKKICGLPVWAFILLLLLAVIVVAAAIVVPLQLVMISRRSDQAASNQNSNNANTTLAVQCQRANPCKNGGINVARSGFCGCVCTNGFLGSQCQIENSSNCTTYSPNKDLVQSAISNATVGDALPKFLNLGLIGFDIGLDPSMLLAVLNQQNVTCETQNSLITFLGSNGTLPRVTNPQAQPSTAEGGLIIDTSTPVIQLSETVLDFARVAVLRYAQELTVENATTVRNGLETTFQMGRDFGEVAFGGGNAVDLGLGKIVINGTLVGGAIGANNPTTSTALAVAGSLPTALAPVP